MTLIIFTFLITDHLATLVTFSYFRAVENTILQDRIICGSCSLTFERSKEYKHCSNCFACTGCEIYYCPGCDNEIIITPVRKAGKKSAD